MQENSRSFAWPGRPIAYTGHLLAEASFLPLIFSRASPWVPGPPKPDPHLSTHSPTSSP